MRTEPSKQSALTRQERQSLQPFVAAPERSVILLDIDGTLAPIVAHAEDAMVPEGTRRLVADLASRYLAVACVSGRRAAEAKRIVAVGSVWYIGGHGSEQLPPGATTVSVNEDFELWAERVRSFAAGAYSDELKRLKVRAEDKGPVIALHWRTSKDHDRAQTLLEELAAQAEASGLKTHWGRKVLELRPPIEINKGTGIERLIAEKQPDFALYAGDDNTDIDAFRRLHRFVAENVLKGALAVGVSSGESPDELTQEADIVVAGPSQLLPLLKALTNENDG